MKGKKEGRKKEENQTPVSATTRREKIQEGRDWFSQSTFHYF